MINRFLRIATLALLAATGLSANAASCPRTSIAPETTLPAAAFGTPYNQTFTASNSNSLPFGFLITSGLPAAVGLSLGATGTDTAALTGSPAQVGNFLVTVTATDTSGCSGGRTYALAVGKGDQTVSYTTTAPAAATVGGASYVVSATASSGLAVVLSIDASASAVCSIAGSTVTFQSVGTCVVDANQAGNANYNAAPQVQQAFAVGQGSQAITFTSTAPAAAVVAGASYTATATATSGLPVTLSIDASASAVCSITGSSVTFQNAGTCVIDANQAGNANYGAAPQVQQSFSVGPGNQTITFTSTAPTAVVAGATYTVTATATSGLPVTFAIDASASSVCSIATDTVSFQGAGTCVINANQSGDTNWNPAPQAQQSFAVGKGSQTITFTSTAPTAASTGGATYAVTATATSGLTVTFTIDPSAAAVCSISGSTVSFIGGGTCVIDANQAGDANWNAAPQVQQSFTVSACITLAVGQVVLDSMPGGANFCVANADAANAEYTYLPINTGTTTDSTLSVTASNIVAVTGPPTPIAPDAHSLPLAPLSEPAVMNVHAVDAPPAFPAGHTIDSTSLARPDGTPVTPLTVGQLIDINASIGGCGAATDIRKGRVEAITTAQSVGQQLLYAVQEVVETTPGAADWHPPVVGGFQTVDFQNIVDSMVQAPPGSTPVGTGSLAGLLKTGALDLATNNFGALGDIDNNGGVVIFYTKKMNELSPPATGSAAYGLFQPRDMFTSASCAGSNQREILYMLVPDPTGVVNSNVRTVSLVYGNAGPTIAHHMEHLFNAERRLYFNGAAPFEETWLDEALAWEMQELVFFNVSVGLAPRGNIQLSTLTTGPSASTRVADFNTYENPMWGSSRSYFYQLPGSTAGKRLGPLRPIPYSIGSTPDTHEIVAPNFSIGYMFLRYALDRKNTGDTALLNSLVNTNQTGVSNLQAAFGINANDWMRDFLVAMYTDDAGIAGLAAQYTAPSWSYRSVFGGLGGFPMAVDPLTNATPLTFALGIGGGTRYTRFGIAPGQTATMLMTEGGVSPTSPITTAIVRTK